MMFVNKVVDDLFLVHPVVAYFFQLKSTQHRLQTMVFPLD